MQTPDRKQRSDTDSSSSIPDLVRPRMQALSPMDLVTRAIQGFCSPPMEADLSQQGLSQSCLPPSKELRVDLQQQHSTHSALSDEEEEEDHHSKETAEEDHDFDNDSDNDDEDDDEENMLVVETVAETARIVRVVRGLEILIVTMALLVFTVSALKGFGVELEWYAKIDPSAPAFVSVVKSKNSNKLAVSDPISNTCRRVTALESNDSLTTCPGTTEHVPVLN